MSFAVATGNGAVADDIVAELDDVLRSIVDRYEKTETTETVILCFFASSATCTSESYHSISSDRADGFVVAFGEDRVALSGDRVKPPPLEVKLADDGVFTRIALGSDPILSPRNCRHGNAKKPSMAGLSVPDLALRISRGGFFHPSSPGAWRRGAQRDARPPRARRTVSIGRHNRHRREPPESRAVSSAGRMVSSLFRSDKSGNPAYILVEKVRDPSPIVLRQQTDGTPLPGEMMHYSLRFPPLIGRVLGVPKPPRTTNRVRRMHRSRSRRSSGPARLRREPKPARPRSGSDPKKKGVTVA